MATSQPIALPSSSSHQQGDYHMNYAGSYTSDNQEDFNPASYTRHFLGSPLSWKAGSFGGRFYPGSPTAQLLSSLDPNELKYCKFSSSLESDRGSLLNAYNIFDKEGDLCRNYTCCGLHLNDLHALLEHFEEVHVIVSDPNAPQIAVPFNPQAHDVVSSNASVVHPRGSESGSGLGSTYGLGAPSIGHPTQGANPNGNTPTPPTGNAYGSYRIPQNPSTSGALYASPRSHQAEGVPIDPDDMELELEATNHSSPESSSGASAFSSATSNGTATTTPNTSPSAANARALVVKTEDMGRSGWDNSRSMTHPPGNNHQQPYLQQPSQLLQQPSSALGHALGPLGGHYYAASAPPSPHPQSYQPANARTFASMGDVLDGHGLKRTDSGVVMNDHQNGFLLDQNAVVDQNTDHDRSIQSGNNSVNENAMPNPNSTDMVSDIGNASPPMSMITTTSPTSLDSALGSPSSSVSGHAFHGALRSAPHGQAHHRVGMTHARGHAPSLTRHASLGALSLAAQLGARSVRGTQSQQRHGPYGMRISHVANAMNGVGVGNVNGVNVPSALVSRGSMDNIGAGVHSEPTSPYATHANSTVSLLNGGAFGNLDSASSSLFGAVGSEFSGGDFTADGTSGTAAGPGAGGVTAYEALSPLSAGPSVGVSAAYGGMGLGLGSGLSSFGLGAVGGAYASGLASAMSSPGLGGVSGNIGVGQHIPSARDAPVNETCVPPALLFSPSGTASTTPVSTPAGSRPPSPITLAAGGIGRTKGKGMNKTGSPSGSAYGVGAGPSSAASSAGPSGNASGTSGVAASASSAHSIRHSTTLSRPASSLLLSKPFKCPKPNCNKSYKQANGLKYHMTHGSCNFAPPKDVEIRDALLEARRREGLVGEGGANLSRSNSLGKDGQADGAGDLSSISESELREVEREAERRLRPFACGVGDCQRRYKNMNGLRYHYQHSGDHGQIGLALLASGQHRCLGNGGSSEKRREREGRKMGVAAAAAGGSTTSSTAASRNASRASSMSRTGTPVPVGGGMSIPNVPPGSYMQPQQQYNAVMSSPLMQSQGFNVQQDYAMQQQQPPQQLAYPADVQAQQQQQVTIAMGYQQQYAEHQRMQYQQAMEQQQPQQQQMLQGQPTSTIGMDMPMDGIDSYRQGGMYGMSGDVNMGLS